MRFLGILYLVAFYEYFYGFKNVVSQDCPSSEAKEYLFLNVGDDVVLHVETDERLNGYFRLYHDRKRICTINLFFLDIHLNCHPGYENRTSAVVVRAEPDHMELNITFFKAERADNGSYNVQEIFGTDYSKCFLVYILDAIQAGTFSHGPPASVITVTPDAIDVGNGGIVSCSANSTTIPGTHNLTMHILWYTDGQIIKTGTRFRVKNDELIIHVVTKADINLIITCEAKEERGPATTTNTTLPVYWGPDPGPELQPANTFYHIEPGVRLPNIDCSIDCHPPCDVRWYKRGSPEVLSFSGTLSLGIIDRNSTGVYTCIATYSRTTTKRRISLFILIKEDQEHTHSNTWTTAASSEFNQNYTPLGAVGGALGAVLLLSLICIIFLLRRGITSKLCNPVSSNQRNDPVEMSVKTPRYEDLPDNYQTASQQYEALNTDVVRAAIKGSGTNKTTQDLTRRQNDSQSEMMVYENTCIDQRD